MIDFRYSFKYLKYLLLDSRKKDRFNNSELLLDFYSKVIKGEGKSISQDLLREHANTLRNKERINIGSFGAGSKLLKSKQKISKIAAISSVSKKYGKLLFRLIEYLQPRKMLELGTSIGISTMYIASGNRERELYTLEGCKEKQNVAKQLASKLKLDNVHFLLGDFKIELPQLLNRIEALNFVYIDGDHSKDRTLEYFQMILPKLSPKSILVLDDIHWSKGMEDAWDTIKKNDYVNYSIDLFRMGVLFVNYD